MAIRIRKAGILNTVQDLGRLGHRRQGINPSGAMDHSALRILNVLLGNSENEAAIELHFPAGEIEFLSECTFCITGADFGPRLNGGLIENWSTHRAGEGSILSFARRSDGQRAYLGIAGGFCVEHWLGSASTNLAVGVGGWAGRRLESGDRVDLNEIVDVIYIDLRAGTSLTRNYKDPVAVRMTMGGEFDWLTPLAIEILFTERFQITSESNRMGYRLSGKGLNLLDPLEIVSTAVDFGTVQLLPNGQMVILMADHQTTGGYPRIGHIVGEDLSAVAQLGPGERLTFVPVSIGEAERIGTEFERYLALLRMGRRFAVSDK